MASSRGAFHADAEVITPLIGGEQADPVAVAPSAAAPIVGSLDAAWAELERFERSTELPPVPVPWWRRLPFVRPDPNSIPVAHPLNAEQIKKLYKSSEPGYFERSAMEHQFKMACLEHYNKLNSETQYEPAPGKVTRYSHFDKGMCWTHGNFVARRKRAGCFSFMPGPRTLFFFEAVYGNGYSGLVTCTPLDEPVTEAYSVLGFPLWFSKRRSGKLDTICNICSCRREMCTHDNFRRVCEMCYKFSTVLHPEVFGFGCTDPPHPTDLFYH